MKMKLITVAIAGGLGILLSGCSTTKPYAPNLFSPTTQVVTKTVNVPQALPAVEASYGYGNDPAIVKAYEMYRKTGKAKNVYTDGFVSFAYSISEQPIIQCAPGFACTIEFQEGELIKPNGFALGDTANWTIAPLFIGGTWPNGAEVLVVKPKYPGVSTNLVVTTDKRLYNIALVSADTTKYARLVTFYYPSDTDKALSQMASQAQAEEQKQGQSILSSSPNLNLSTVNFNYSMSGDDPTWKPIRVFDDGTHTFIEFPSILSSTDLPVLYVYHHGDQELVNWRKSGDYYVVDRLFKQAVLLTGAGSDQTLVKITNNVMK